MGIILLDLELEGGVGGCQLSSAQQVGLGTACMRLETDSGVGQLSWKL